MNFYSVSSNYFRGNDPKKLIEKYGTPLYVYNEEIIRKSCKEIKSMVKYPKFSVNYSVKANSNLHLLKIVSSEGICADAVSPGEIFVLLEAGFKPENIMFVSNNISKAEMSYAIEKGILISVDSLSQLETYGELNPGGKVAVRFNPGIGAGHHDKVITGGKKTKFGINSEYIEDVKNILKNYNLKLVGINQHIGSLFMQEDDYIQSIDSLLEIANHFEEIEFIDLGGGFGIPYHKQDEEKRLNIEQLGTKLDMIFTKWLNETKRDVTFKVEPGRYIVAESCILLGSVNSIKQNHSTKYIGTDIGFNVLARPVMYDSHHDIEIYRNGTILKEAPTELVTVVGNICETGDIIAKDRLLPKIIPNDILGIMDAGAYGFSMSSNYNNRLRPAEVLIKEDGSDILIRKRDTLEDLIRNF